MVVGSQDGMPPYLLGNKGYTLVPLFMTQHKKENIIGGHALGGQNHYNLETHKLLYIAIQNCNFRGNLLCTIYYVSILINENTFQAVCMVWCRQK